MQQTIYIKFIDKNDVFALEPLYCLVPEGEPTLFCSRCGDTHYLPIDIIVSEEFSISQPGRDLYRPFPLDNPYLIVIGEPELPSLTVNRGLSPDEQERLKLFRSVTWVDETGFEMLIEAHGTEPVKHQCEDLKRGRMHEG